jgi:transposase
MGGVARFALSGMKRPRRRWTLAEKLAIVEAAKTSGDPVSVVARRHGMNANHLFNWLQRDRDGTLDRAALYVESGGPLAFIDLGGVGEAPARPTAMIEIDLPGGARITR